MASSTFTIIIKMPKITNIDLYEILSKFVYNDDVNEWTVIEP